MTTEQDGGRKERDPDDWREIERLRSSADLWTQAEKYRVSIHHRSRREIAEAVLEARNREEPR